MKYGVIPPKKLPEQDTKLMMMQAERHNRAVSAHNTWAEPAKKSVDFFEGRQWSPEILASFQTKRRPALTFNLIAPLVRLMSGYQRNNKTDIIFRPGNDGQSSQDVAELLTALEKNVSQVTKQSYVDTEVFLDGIVTGRGYFRTLMNFDNNDLGDVKCQAADPFAVFLDPDGDTYDLNESAGFIQFAKYLSIDQIEDMYGDKVSTLLKPFTMGQTPHSPVMSIMVNDEITPIRNFGAREGGSYEFWDTFYATVGEFVDTTRKSLKVIETEHKIREMRNVCFDLETGDSRPLPEDWDKDRIARLMYYGEQIGNPVKVEKRMVSRIQWTTTCGDLVLYNRPSMYDTFSIAPYFPYFRRGHTRGAVQDLIDPQIEKNKRRSVELEIVAKTSNGGWSYHQDSLDPVQERNLKTFGSSPGFNMKWKGEREPHRVEPGVPPIAHEKLEQKAEQDLMRISGINESALGQMDNAQSGRAIEARQRQAVIAIQMYMDNFSRSKQLVGEKRLECYQGHYTEQRMFRILGEDGKIVAKTINRFDGATKTVENDITIGKYLSTVDETPMSATFANAQFEEMLTLLEKMGPAMGPYIPAFGDLIMDLSSMPRKEEWAERLKAIMPQMLGFDPFGAGGAPQGIPATDEAGNPVIDPATGQPIMLDPATGQPLPPQGPPGAAPPGAPPPGQAQLPPPQGAPPTAPPGPPPQNAPAITQGQAPGGQTVQVGR